MLTGEGNKMYIVQYNELAENTNKLKSNVMKIERNFEKSL